MTSPSGCCGTRDPPADTRPWSPGFVVLGVGRFYLETTWCDDERKYRKCPGFPVEGELESLREKRLQHQPDIRVRGLHRHSRLKLVRVGGIGIVAGRARPTRQSFDRRRPGALKGVGHERRERGAAAYQPSRRALQRGSAKRHGAVAFLERGDLESRL